MPISPCLRYSISVFCTHISLEQLRLALSVTISFGKTACLIPNFRYNVFNRGLEDPIRFKTQRVEHMQGFTGFAKYDLTHCADAPVGGLFLTSSSLPSQLIIQIST